MDNIWNNYYFLIIMLSVATIICFLWLFFFCKKRLNTKWWEILIIAVLHTVIGVGTVKLFAFLESSGASGDGAMSLFGGLFFMPVVYLVYAKIKKLKVFEVFDVFTICLAITYTCARFNCLHEGCCLGKYIDSVAGTRYPTRELEIAFHALSAIGGGFLIYKNLLNEKVFLIYLGSYGVFRFIIEFFRESSSQSVFHIAHLWSALSIIFVITTLIIQAYLKKVNEEENKTKKKR